MADLWMAEFVSSCGHCLLCGNYGIIPFRNDIHTPAGHRVTGRQTACICPNGRALKKMGLA